MRSGFSLVELSIVLVILGLLTGGILAGQNLIRAAELRSVVTEFQKYQTAVMTFRDKYFALPGDIRNATAFWGALDAGDGLGTDCHGVEATGSATCNGDGDGHMGSLDTSTGGGNNIQGERFRFWQHLANAGLIEGSFTGKTDSTTITFAQTRGKNVPPSKISSSFWTVEGAWDHAGNVTQFKRPGGIMLNLDTTAGGSGLFAEEVWSIDRKVDDGLPGKGRIHSSKLNAPTTPGCSTTDDGDTAVYAVTYKANTCRFTVFAD